MLERRRSSVAPGIHPGLFPAERMPFNRKEETIVVSRSSGQGSKGLILGEHLPSSAQ